MKILIFADAENTHTQKWLRFFYDRRVDVEIATLRESSFAGIPVHLLKSKTYQNRESNRAYNRFKVLREVFPQLKRILNTVKPDIIHAHYASSFGLYAALIGFHPFILSVWGSDIVDFPRNSLLERKIIKFVLKKADIICASSEYLSQVTGEYSDKVPKIIYFGVDTDEFKPQPEFSKSEDKFIFGTIKSLFPHYGINYLIEAAAMIKDRINDWELWIGGEGDEEVKLKELTLRLKLADRVKFLGKVPHFEVPEILDQMNVFVVPSLAESFGVAAAEASACELPVIASCIGGLPEIIRDSETGYLVEPADPRSIADKLIHLYRNPNLRREMGKAGRKIVKERFEWKTNAHKMLNMYENLIEKN